MTGPVSGGLLAVDFDGPGSEEQFQQVFNLPSSELPASISLRWLDKLLDSLELVFELV